MRHIVFLLLAANILYLGWNLYQDPVAHAGVRTLPPMPEGIHQLVTLEERPDHSPPRVHADDPEAAEQVLSQGEQLAMSCKSLGPFLEHENLESVSSRLADGGLEPVRRPVEKEVISDYWVYLPAEDREMLRKNIRQLKAHDITDYQQVDNNSISLGIFKSEKRAHDRLENIRAIGLQADLERRYKPRVEFWLDMAGTEQSAVLLTQLAEENAGLGIESLGCEQMAAHQSPGQDAALQMQASLP